MNEKDDVDVHFIGSKPQRRLGEFVDDLWEIVFEGPGPAGYIGKVVEDHHDARVVRLDPCFHYLSTLNVRPHPSGGAEFNPNTRLIFPVEMLGSAIKPIIVYTRRYQLRDWDPADLEAIDKGVGEAMRMRQQLVAARSNIQLATTLPKGPPPGAPPRPPWIP